MDSTNTVASLGEDEICIGDSNTFSSSVMKNVQSILSVFSMNPFQKLLKNTRRGVRRDIMEWNGMEWNAIYNELDKKGLYLFRLHTFTHPFHSIYRYKFKFTRLSSFTCLTSLSTTSFVTANGNETFSDISFSNSGVSGLMRRYRFNLR